MYIYNLPERVRIQREETLEKIFSWIMKNLSKLEVLFVAPWGKQQSNFRTLQTALEEADVFQLRNFADDPLNGFIPFRGGYIEVRKIKKGHFN